MTQKIGEPGIIYGDTDFLVPCHMNYGKIFLDTIWKFKEKIALVNGFNDDHITYNALAQQIVNTAASLTTLGLKKGEVVAICSENRVEYIVTALAVIYAGGVITFLNTSYSKGEIVHSVNISKPKYVFLSGDGYKKHYKTLNDMNMINKFVVYDVPSEVKKSKIKPTMFKDLVSKFTDFKSYRYADFNGYPENAMIVYSSGTTGLPKGAISTHLNLIATSKQAELCSRDLPIFTVAPWCNCLGIMTSLDNLFHGKTYIFLPRFEEKLYLQTIEKFKPGILMCVPPLVIVLCKSTILENYNVSSVETMISGGAPLDSDTIIQVKKRLPNLKHILQGYGMTEATGGLCREIETVSKLGSVGKVAAGNIIKVEDVRTRSILGPNQTGEICVKGPVLFKGYIGKKSELDEDGFFRTGDLGYYDEEGFFFLVDRLKELIKYKAWQVAPSELEAVMLQHPAVKDVGVIGTPDREAGEVPVAFVVKQQRVTDKELMVYVASKVSPWKQIRGGVKFVDEIPKNGSGKILRRELKKMLIGPPSSKL